MKLTNEQISSIRHRINLDQATSVVRVDVSEVQNISAEESNLNVYCVDASYNIIWRVNAPLSSYSNDFFVYIKCEGGILKAKRFDGDEFEIDEKTGIATLIGWHK